YAYLGEDVAVDDTYALFCEDLYRGMKRFRGEASVRTWAYRIAQHALARYMRTRQVERERFRALPSSGFGTHTQRSVPAFSIEDGAQTVPPFRTTVRDLWMMMSRRLTPDEKRLVEMYLDGSPWEEIAETLAVAAEAEAAEATSPRRAETPAAVK